MSIKLQNEVSALLGRVNAMEGAIASLERSVQKVRDDMNKPPENRGPMKIPPFPRVLRKLGYPNPANAAKEAT